MVFNNGSRRYSKITLLDNIDIYNLICRAICMLCHHQPIMWFSRSDHIYLYKHYKRPRNNINLRVSVYISSAHRHVTTHNHHHLTISSSAATVAVVSVYLIGIVLIKRSPCATLACNYYWHRRRQQQTREPNGTLIASTTSSPS